MKWFTQKTMALLFGGALTTMPVAVFAAEKVRTSAARFEAFASLRPSSSNGEAYMNTTDFVKSLSIMKGASFASEGGFIETLFRRIDSDGDGVLNYEEYCMFYTLLTNTEKNFRVAFQMFDRQSKGKINATEFEDLMTSLVADPSVKINFKGGLTEFLFGPRYDKEITFSTLYSLVNDVRNDVWWHEFRQLDHQGKGKISLKTLHDFIVGSDVVQTSFSEMLVTFETYKMLNEILLNSTDMLIALKFLQAGGVECNRRAFVRSLKLTGLHATRADVDALFQLFDIKGEGSIDLAQFEEIVKRRQSFDSPVVDHQQPSRSWAQEMFYCMQQRE